MTMRKHNLCDFRGEVKGEVKCRGCGGRTDVWECRHSANQRQLCTLSLFQKSRMYYTPVGGQESQLDRSYPACSLCQVREYAGDSTNMSESPEEADLQRRIAARMGMPVKQSRQPNNRQHDPASAEVAGNGRTFQDLLFAEIGKPDAVIIDIGAYDGVFQSESKRHIDAGGKAILVEPSKRAFAKLDEQYRGKSNVVLANVAIAGYNGSGHLRVLRDANAPEWLLGSSTLEELNRELCRGPEWENQKVDCCTISTLLGRNNVTRLDGLSIDAEGMDWEILKQFDLKTLRPKAIKVELGNLPPATKDRVKRKLAEDGYAFWEINDGWDLVATPHDLLSGPVDIVVPVVEKDIAYLRNLIRCHQKWVDLGGSVWFISPAAHIDTIEHAMTSAGGVERAEVIPETDLIASPHGAGWFVQQAIKLAAANSIVKTPFYLCLDADCFATREVRASDLVIGGQGLASFIDAPPEDMSHLRDGQKARRAARIAAKGFHKADAVQSHPWYRVPAELLGAGMARGVFNVTPAVLNTDLVKQIGTRLCEVNNWQDPWEGLLGVQGYATGGCWTEYTLYQTWAQHLGIERRLHVQASGAMPRLCGNGVWIGQHLTGWDPAGCFNGEQLFSLVQSRTNVGGAWVWKQIEKFVVD